MFLAGWLYIAGPERLTRALVRAISFRREDKAKHEYDQGRHADRPGQQTSFSQRYYLRFFHLDISTGCYYDYSYTSALPTYNIIIILSYYISFQPDKLIVQWALYNINTYIYICTYIQN